MRKFIKAHVLLLFFVSVTSYTQNNIEVTGKVIAFKNTPLNTVEVYSKALKKTVFTDSLGVFIIDIAKKKDVLVFSAAGFRAYTLKIKSKVEILNVKMIYLNNKSAYHQVINGGYMEEKQLDYCIETEMGENNDYSKMNSIYEIIQSENSMVKFVTENGKTQVIFNSRGDTSVYASNAALLVVNGVIVDDISDIRPIQVSAVKVFVGNDAGHWGIRGSSGVVEIELKQGKL